MADVDFTGWGHSYDEVLQHLNDLGVDAPPRAADINDIFTTPGRDAINEGAGPIGEALIAGGIVGAARGLAVRGAADVVGAAVSNRALSMGVATSTDEAVAGPTALEQDAVSATQKVIKYGVAGAAGTAAFDRLPGE